MAAPSRYAQMMNRLARRIFNEPLRPLDAQGRKIVKVTGDAPLESSHFIKSYYPPHPQIFKLIRTLRDHGLFRDEHLDFNEEMERQRILRGKIPWGMRMAQRKKEGAPAAKKKK